MIRMRPANPALGLDDVTEHFLDAPLAVGGVPAQQRLGQTANLRGEGCRGAAQDGGDLDGSDRARRVGHQRPRKARSSVSGAAFMGRRSCEMDDHA